jgi:hypothetical protein
MTPSDRLSRQTLLLNLYELQKTLSSARTAARTAAAAVDARRKTGDTATPETAARLSQLQADATAQLNTAANVSRAIEGYSGLPTADQRRQAGWAFDDARKTIDELNALLRTESLPGSVRPLPAKR